jgi:putative nucleotidyltransferase with HDIG domain
MKKERTLAWAAKTGLIGLLLLGLGTALALILGQTVCLALPDLSGALTAAIESLKTLKRPETPPWMAELVSLVGGAALLGLILSLYLKQFRPSSFSKPGHGWLLVLLVILFLGLAWLMIPAQPRLAYLYPLAALAVLATILSEARFSMLLTILMGLVTGYLSNGSLQITVYVTLGGLMGVLSLGKTVRTNRVLWSGAYVALSNVTVSLIFTLLNQNIGPFGLLELLAAGVANGALSASLALVTLFLLGNLFGITTSLQLTELTQPTHPLLQRLLLHAPGTYHHSLMVGNLAEQAAEWIGADALLTRVGAYYHDVGKLQQPALFVENQLSGTEVEPPRLDPQSYAQHIIDHVSEGLKLARKHRLPADVRAFIAEHHGTSLVKFFYHRAIEQAADPNQVAEASFRYPGPRPGRKETALLMLADSCEAAVRASQPASVEELERLVNRIVNDKINEGQLDECDLTLSELKSIRQTFVSILQGMFHQRVIYPAQPEPEVVDTTYPVVMLEPPHLPLPYRNPRSNRNETIEGGQVIIVAR